jgi:hypothetical protein
MMSVDETTLDPGKRLPLETANYIAELTAELSSLAQRANLEQVAYLLDLARLEAERVAALSDDFRSD